MSDASCRILIVASTLQEGLDLVTGVKELETSTSKPASELPPDATKIVPWTISNKYYTAEVHFQVCKWTEWSASLAQEVPAVIFVWRQSEPYKDKIQLLAQGLASCDPEVALAVRLRGDQTIGSIDAEDEIDEHLSSLGFEFVDSGAGTLAGTPGLLADGIPGLPRVVDALSTIMWPSMIQSVSTSDRKSKARELLDWAKEEEQADGLRALIDPSQPDPDGSIDLLPNKKSRMHKEMEELERWLEDDEMPHDSSDPWINTHSAPSSSLADPLAMNTSPTTIEALGMAIPWMGGSNSGFDDDFTVFVSAPPPEPAHSLASGRSSPDASFDSANLSDAHLGVSYRSLGSVSDFGDTLEGDDDLGLPSEAEIQETSSRIFGASLSPPLAQVRPQVTRSSTVRSAAPPASSSPPTISAVPFSASSSFSTSDAFDSDDDDDVDYDMEKFDLSRVLGALQNMKEEIAGMENEDERRKAAARAALGLVYGLERRGGDD